MSERIIRNKYFIFMNTANTVRRKTYLVNDIENIYRFQARDII